MGNDKVAVRIEITPKANGFGAEIGGVDLAAGVSDAAIQAARASGRTGVLAA